MDALIAMVLGFVLVIGSTVSGQQEALCTALGGTYTPEAAQVNICPGGDWGKLFQAVQAK